MLADDSGPISPGLLLGSPAASLHRRGSLPLDGGRPALCGGVWRSVHAACRRSWSTSLDSRLTVRRRQARSDPGWRAAFERVRTIIVGVLGPSALAVEHVGSTAVPGLCAKPIIDVELIVADSAAEDDYLAALEAVGFTLAIREHRLLEGTDPRSNVHVFSRGAVEPRRACAFRDWLQSHPEDRAVYGEHKVALAERCFADVTSYNMPRLD